MKAIDVTRLRERRVFQGRKFEARPALFPGYCFVLIELQWHAARWAPGTLGLVMDGITPARVPERVIAESHRREVNGLIEVSKPSFRAGDRLRARDGQKLARAGQRAVENMLEARAASTIKSRLNVALSRRKQGFESPRERHVQRRHLKSFSFSI